MMPVVFALRISRPHRKIRTPSRSEASRRPTAAQQRLLGRRGFGDGRQSGFTKSALPVGGSIEANRIAESLSVTPHFEDLGTTPKPKKAARHPQMPHTPSESAMLF